MRLTLFCCLLLLFPARAEVIKVAPGVYRERVVFKNSGAAKQTLKFNAEIRGAAGSSARFRFV